MPNNKNSAGRVLMNFFANYNLLIILVAIFILFSILLPKTFPTAFNIQSMLNYQSISVLLALAVMVPITAGHFDMSVGYTVCIMHILAIGLQAKSGLPWGIVVLILLAGGLLIGVINGLLITKVGINSFIATLGVGTILYGLAFWYTDGQQVIGNVSKNFLAIAGTVAGIPTTAIITTVIAILLWILFDYLPLGRYFYFLGASAKASELSGISVKKYTMLAFIMSSFFTTIASIMLAALLRVGQVSVGSDYLMPAFAGALLGTVAFHPGRANVWGTVCAVLMLAVALSGLQQLGAKYFVEPLFNGSILIIAVSIAVYTEKKRATKIKEMKNEQLCSCDPEVSK